MGGAQASVKLVIGCTQSGASREPGEGAPEMGRRRGVQGAGDMLLIVYWTFTMGCISKTAAHGLRSACRAEEALSPSL